MLRLRGGGATLDEAKPPEVRPNTLSQGNPMHKILMVLLPLLLIFYTGLAGGGVVVDTLVIGWRPTIIYR